MPPILPSSTPNLPDQHIRKRPFQPSITSYFDQRAGPSSSSAASSTNSRRPTTDGAWDAYSPPILSPPVPEETQASLLSVGMRVRKSVPEGYKTHKTLGDGMGSVEGGVSRSELGSKVPSSSAPAKVGRGRVGSGAGAAARGARELMPFCGLHKVGGLGVSSSFGDAREDEEDEEEEDVPGLTWSQETVGSSQGSLKGSGFGIGDGYAGSQTESKKRTYDEEMEEEMDAYFEGGTGEATEMGQAGVAGRKIAKPRGAVGKKGGNVSGGVEGDFEEASFLAPMEVDEEW
ncbi:hypothetical protein KC316_g10193 [Hortaea werneckii]|nr:hypothetical protein KC324_g10922 [Hortaea werneckii]KAI7577692.1 hypothetical protein KC316_g10193 [Hortaea werneckii]